MDQSNAVAQWTLDLYPLAEQPRLSLVDCQALVDRAWWFHRGAPGGPKVCPIEMKQALAIGGRILLPSWAMVASVVLHEVAHCLLMTESDFIARESGHDPAFVALVADLYRMHLGASMTVMRATAHRHGVRGLD